MYHFELHEAINEILREKRIDVAGRDNRFYMRIIANAAAIFTLFDQLYGLDPRAEPCFERLIRTMADAHCHRPAVLQEKDEEKQRQGLWYCSNDLVGMSLYVDRWCGGLEQLPGTFGYLKKLGVNLLHLMPVFQSPPAESDGGYAVSDFRSVDPRFGTLQDLQKARKIMGEQGIHLMLDIALNHTSRQHEWAEKARRGDAHYQDYFYFFSDRSVPDQYECRMPEVFPESSPGNFTYIEECQKWVMTVFHSYQWDLNYRNPEVLIAMLENIFFYANLGVDILRIDAPAFIWKECGTSCQNLPEAHSILRLIKQCVQAATPGMALLGEAIVAPTAILKYFGTGVFTAKECDLAYNATQMALQWDALATGDTRIMLAAQPELLKKPAGVSWITYTRCHDDIGLGYDDYMIAAAGYYPMAHRKFLQDYYSGRYPGSDARGALFSVNPATQDARISGTLASLCGLEAAGKGAPEGVGKSRFEAAGPGAAGKGDVAGAGEAAREGVRRAIDKILLMQAHSFFIGGIPMLFYGDEAGYTNDYSYLDDPGKSYDNRWMHRPVIDWRKNARTEEPGTTEQAIFSGTQKLIAIRKKLALVGDWNNLYWLGPHHVHVAGYVRVREGQRLYCLFNFSRERAFLTWYALREHGPAPGLLYDHWTGQSYRAGADTEYLVIEPFSFLLLESINLA
ncbi:MAG TPA: alpha-amylase family glycosyl hydrolase [Puia sp.]|nr:alpha-amylase family glycosyl hydrolase [Puia sp.]